MGTWPARSPDLIRLDFCKFDFLKTEFFKERINNLQELMALIRLKCNEILQHIFNNMKRRVVFCMQQNGGHFQHLL
jgi:hypothetical protein